MGADLNFLRVPLTPTKEPLEAGDTRLTALDGLAKKNAWADLEARVDELVGAGIYDIRPLSYYFFAVFVRGGLGQLTTVLESAAILLVDQFDAVGPKKKHVEQFDRRLAWLFDEISASLRYHEQKKTPEWTAWSEVDVSAITGSLAAAAAVETPLASGSFARAARALGGLSDWLRGREEALRALPKPEPASPEAADPKDEAPAADAAAPAGDASPLTVTMVVSHRFLELAGKLRAFEALMQKRQYAKAAVVADDVLQRLDQFDPREYFPDFVAPFSAVFSEHVDVLTEQLDRRDTPQWKALAQYYRVDLKGFVGA